MQPKRLCISRRLAIPASIASTLYLSYQPALSLSLPLRLTFGKEYTDVSQLRYGHLMIMADQDHDGSHIKGLLINFLHHFWPSLLKIDGFLKQFITPIVKCSKGKKEQTFFTIPEYITWKDDNNEGKGWKIKYYKGFY